MESTRKVTTDHQKKMVRFERQQNTLLMEIKEVKSMINEMKYSIIGTNDIDDDVDEANQSIIALNKTTEELEDICEVLISKQHQASDELNLALQKLTHIAMKYSSSSTRRTTTEQNRTSENATMMAKDQKTEAENLKRRVIELEKELCEKKAMELEMEQLKEALDVTKRLGCDQNLEMEKEIEELKRKLNEKELDVLEGQEALIANKTEKIQSTTDLLEEKKAFEVENEQLNAMKNMGGGCDDDLAFELKKEIDDLNRKLREKEELLQGHEVMNKLLYEKELSIDNELREARKELILGLREMSSSLVIGVKTMGELDLKPFLDALSKLKCPAEEALTRSIQLCWTWREQIKDKNWHPFKIAKVGEKDQEVIDEEDEKLKSLKEELGEEVFKVVTTAVMELNRYNLSSYGTREPVQEIWNFKEGKRATLKEGISFMSRMMRIYLRRT